jgi:hypothetical protein
MYFNTAIIKTGSGVFYFAAGFVLLRGAVCKGDYARLGNGMLLVTFLLALLPS